MINFINFIYNIFEGSKTKFDIKVSDLNSLKESFPNLAINNNDIFKQFLDDIFDTPNEDKYIICSDGGTYFKIPYSYSERIIELSEKYKDTITIKVWANKIKVYGKVRNRLRLLFVTGEGSISKISTEEQETATCLVWNSYIELLRANPKADLTTDMVKDFVKEIIKDESWVSTFTKQIIGIIKAAKYLGVINIADYKLCRYGTSEDEDNIGNAYAKYLNKYAGELGVKKHNVDPTDVLLYNEKEVNNILQILKELRVSKDIIASKDLYIEKLIDTKLLLGISLKKIYSSEASFDIYNIGQHTKIDDSIISSNNFNYRIVKVRGENYFKVECTGKFNFDKADIANAEGQEITKENLIILQMRTFGNNQVGLECYIKNIKINSPAIGKCAKAVWVKELDVKPNTDIKDCINTFRQKLESNDDNINKQMLLTFIRSSIKEGPNCFPFILIH